MLVLVLILRTLLVHLARLLVGQAAAQLVKPVMLVLVLILRILLVHLAQLPAAHLAAYLANLVIMEFVLLILVAAQLVKLHAEHYTQFVV